MTDHLQFSILKQLMPKGGPLLDTPPILNSIIIIWQNQLSMFFGNCNVLIIVIIVYVIRVHLEGKNMHWLP